MEIGTFFSKIGALTFGGGSTIIVLIQDMLLISITGLHIKSSSTGLRSASSLRAR
jgi:hypothetical protein